MEWTEIGNHNPAFLIAWGSGQNALLTYLIIPFIQIFGLTTLAVRLPMAILGCISLIIMYLLLNKISNKKIAIIGLAFFAICPWHIMKSRWGLESNLFPDLILIFIYLLVKGLEDKNKFIYYSSFVIAGMTTYSYGTSYFFLPIFIIPILIILIKKNQITVKQAIISLLIIVVISLPIIIFVLINTFNLQEISLPFMTIPKLEVNRYKEITSIFSKDFFTVSINNFLESMKILLLQTDGLQWNSIQPFGLIYIFSGVFTIVGIVFSFRVNEKVKVKYGYIFNAWFIVSIILTFICEPNINRLNIMMIPIIYYSIIGIYVIINNKKNIAIGISLLYAISFTMFIHSYFNQDWNKYHTFENGLEEVIEYVDSLENKQIFITNKIKEPYIYILFYTKANTEQFVKNVEYYDEHVEFRQVKKFGKYNFRSIAEIENNKNVVYIIKKEDLEKYNLDGKNIEIVEFEKYYVIENK